MLRRRPDALATRRASMATLSAPVSTLYPARKGTRPVAAGDLWTVPRVGAPAPMPDGSAVIVPVTRSNLEQNEAKTQLFQVPVAGGKPRALTATEQSAAEPRVSPDGTRLVFTRKDAGGKAQLMLMELSGGEGRRLTDLPLGVFDPRWLPDGSGILFGTSLVKGHLTPERTAT